MRNIANLIFFFFTLILGVAGMTDRGIPSLSDVTSLYCRNTNRPSIDK